MVFSVTEVNEMDLESFVDAFGGIVERSPVLLAAIWHSRPFGSTTQILASIHESIAQLPREG